MIKLGGLALQGSPLIAGHLKVNVPAAHFTLDNHGVRPLADNVA